MSAEQINQTNFSETISKGVVLVDFFATWCGPCKMIAPVLDQLVGEYEGKAKIVKIDVEEAPAIAQEFNVFSVPTLILFKDGQKVHEVAGFQTKDMLVKLIEKAL